MGVANLTPGVSGGTIAMISGVLERLTGSIKSLNKKNFNLLLKGAFSEFTRRTTPKVPIMVFSGILLAVFLFAKVLDFLLVNYAVFTWAFFFGIVLASVYFIGKKIEKWRPKTYVFGIIGFGIAFSISFLNPATPNPAAWYVFLCGVIAISSMILPGMSGSYILVMMGNYQLIFVDAINELNLAIIIPMGLGNLFGLFSLSHGLSYVFEHYKNQTIAIMSGFILGSLGMLWPWKTIIYKLSNIGVLYIDSTGKKVLDGYERYVPSFSSGETYVALLLILVGASLIWAIEVLASKSNKNQTPKTQN